MSPGHPWEQHRLELTRNTPMGSGKQETRRNFLHMASSYSFGVRTNVVTNHHLIIIIIAREEASALVLNEIVQKVEKDAILDEFYDL